jgi:hypothetical protein
MYSKYSRASSKSAVAFFVFVAIRSFAMLTTSQTSLMVSSMLNSSVVKVPPREYKKQGGREVSEQPAFASLRRGNRFF